jgi:hypothetical protein
MEHLIEQQHEILDKTTIYEYLIGQQYGVLYRTTIWSS